MPNKTKNVFKKYAVIIALLLLPAIVISGCSGNMETEPISMPATPQPTEIISYEIEDLFERYTVVGIAAGSVMEVYEQPSQGSPTPGSIPSYGSDILPTGEVHRDGETIWGKIRYKEITGWVDMGFLAEQHGVISDDLILLGQQVLESLKTGQYNLLTPVIDPSSCLRFSPYQYLNSDNQILCPEEIDSLINSTQLLNWGHFDGTGKPIDLTFDDFHQQFVYDQDYQKSTVVGFNLEVSSGNSINNIQEIYPNGIMIEYYFPGFDPQYGGMDWRSLRLVFVPENDQWHLVAIIHGEWTI